MSEGIRGPLLPIVERRGWVDRYIWELLVEFAVIWVLVFGLLTVLLSFVPSTGALSIGADAARAATLVDTAILVLLTVLPTK